MDVAVSTARAGNVIGGGDFANDRIIPDCVRAIQKGEAIIVRNPYSTRPYQHVLEPLKIYLMIAEGQYKNRELEGYYNVGPNESDCRTTGDLVTLFCSLWGSGAEWKDVSEANAPHEASFLRLDTTKVKQTFGWNPRWSVEEAVEKIVEWTKVYFDNGDISAIMDKQIIEFFNSEEK
jgi:CDP-glucose 4,6-dehydratase